MVTLRGKKANAKAKSGTAATDKAASSHATAASTAAASAAATGKAKSNSSSALGSNSTAVALSSQQAKAQELRRQHEEEQQQQLLREKEERVLRLLAFTMQSTLALQRLPGDHRSIANVGNTLVTALCGTGKDKKATPELVLSKLTRHVRKRVCGAIFSSDEISYSCRNCQVDSTCVICQDCFAHSDHTGHDVYFQRTTAGSSCDCGDPHAWKPSSFCSKHPGIDDAEANASRKHKLPKNVGFAAPVVIDAAVEHIFQTLLQAQHGFELANAIDVFSRDVPAHVLVDLAKPTDLTTETTTSTSNHATRALTPRAASRAANALAARRSRSTRATRAAAASSDVVESKPAAHEPVRALTQFSVRLHNDDVHTLTEVVDHIVRIVGVSKAAARDMVNEADRVGDVVIINCELVACGAVVGQLLRSSLNVTATPAWWQARMDALGSVFDWLTALSSSSDGLNELVMDALCKPRTAVVQGFPALSTALAGATTHTHSSSNVDDFVKEHNARMNIHACELLDELVGTQTVADWARDAEAAQRALCTFHPTSSDDTDAKSVVRNASGDLVHCTNVFIHDFLKAVARTPAYSQHQSVRDGVDAVVARFFTPVAQPTPTLSALTLLIQHDCILRKDTVKKAHVLLREHMLATTFRTAMLEAYARSYRTMTTNFLRGLGNSTDTVFDFAVQFLTVPHLVKNYTRKMITLHPERPHLLGELFAALELVFRSAVNLRDGVLNVDHPALSNQKYKHCVDNMEYVLNIGAMSNELVCDLENLSVWLSCLTILQHGDLQVRRGIYQPHVEYESDSWLSMFNLGIRVHSVFPVAWHGFEPSALNARSITLVDIFERIVTATITRSRDLNKSVATKQLASVTTLVTAHSATSISDEAAETSRTIAAYDFNVCADATSLHIPLHRFLAASIRHICIHQSGFATAIASDALLETFGLHVLARDARLELVEMPLRCLVMASQIHSNLWRRNGDENMLAQLYNYSALPYCLHYRDADVFLLQLGVLLLGADDVVALMLNQFQLGGYFVRPTDVAATSSSPPSSMSTSEFDTAHALGYLRMEEGIDGPQMLLLVEEFLRLLIIVGTSLPSATGVAYENAFLAEEMLQQLCAKSYSFSRLFDLAILPSGQDDLAIARLEGILATVSDFVPPSGLESGRYELKSGYLDRYNPYFLHLNRESHELARDKWTSYRKSNLQKRRARAGGMDTSDPPIEPLRAAPPPVTFLQPVQHILLCDATIAVVQLILWKVLRADGVSASSANTVSNTVSDAVISTTLHLLVHGVHTAIASSTASSSSPSTGFFSRLCAVNPALDNTSVLHLLRDMHTKRATILDDEQAGTIEWLVWKIQDASPVCRAFFAALVDEATRSSAAQAAATTPTAAAAAPMTLEQRKDAARKRALDAMAKQQAAFQAMMGGMDGDDGDDDDGISDDQEEKAPANATRLDSASDDDDDEDMNATPSAALVQRGKRRASDVDDEHKKRQKLKDADVDNDDASHKCILCHDTSTQSEMGMAAYVHQSTVLATAFRPEAHEALQPAGKRVRNQVKTLIERMELCSGGPNSTLGDMSPSPRMRYSGAFPDWYMDDSLALDAPMPPLVPVHQLPQRIRVDPMRLPPPAHVPMLENEMLQTDEELDALENVLHMRDDQLHPNDMRRAITMELRGARNAAAAATATAQQLPGNTGAEAAAALGALAGALAVQERPLTTAAAEPRRTLTQQQHHHNLHHHAHHHAHHHHHHGSFSDDSDDDDGGDEFTPGFHTEFAPPGISSANRESAKLYLTPCGLHIRTCQHAVHIHCLERYISSLHEKAIRGEEFDGVQAIDPDSAMTQFLCPLCKTLCNFLIPTLSPTGKTNDDDDADMDNDDDGTSGIATPDNDATMTDISSSRVLATVAPRKQLQWYSIVEEQMRVSGWYKHVLGQLGDLQRDSDSVHDLWRDYFEETLWEPHGSLEKGAPFLWSACAFSIAAFLSVAEGEHDVHTKQTTVFDPLRDACPPSMEKELTSLVAVTKFCRWSFSLLEHSADAKVIWETSKRCCPINSETKREYRKFTKLLGSIDACLRGTILGLLVADTFTAFVVSSVIATDLHMIWRFMPVFSVADVLQRLYAEFFVVDKTEDTSLFQDKFSVAAAATDAKSTAVNNSESESKHDDSDDRVSRTRSGKAIVSDSARPHATKRDASATAVLQALRDALTASGEQRSEAFATLVLLQRLVARDASARLKPLTRSELAMRVARVQSANALFVRRMQLFWRCVSDNERSVGRLGRRADNALVVPGIAAIAESSDAVLDQVWKWCVDRLNSKSYLGVAKTGDKCEHTDGASEAYVASMFILHDNQSVMAKPPQLINLPVQYDELYSQMTGVKCDRCNKVPSDPGLCLICGEYLCCGDACCTRPFINHGPQVGECTRHAAECGGGIAIVLMLDQCRVAIIGGSMAAYFPSPYVDAHGEEDIGLQRGRPLRLDAARYKYLESLWVNHRIFTEVSRQRNQREPQYTVNLSYL